MLYDTGIALGFFVLGMIATGYGFQTLYIVCAILILVIVGLFQFY
ncbi:hypothetical protein [Aquibacillus kalidii]|nr:hypothetical protein [Aquibacillus kalidii]